METFTKITNKMIEEGNVKSNLIDEVKTYYLGTICEKEIILNEALLDCESPIEQMFMIAWIDRGYGNIINDYIDILEVEQQYNLELDGVKMRIDLFISIYLVNFLGHKKLVQIAVEFDGHDFHKSTKQQVSKDNERNMLLQKYGIYVLRFSGSDIWKNPYNSTRILSNFIWAKHYKYLRDSL